MINRMSQRLADIDIDLAKNVAELVGAQTPQQGRPNHGKKAKGLSQTEFPGKTPTIETRRIAIIIADGFDAAAYNGIVAAAKACSVSTLESSRRCQKQRRLTHS